ncbi:hypothetical protein D9613_002527 [Agrocybe pediades]|uniref:Uncharacterized protein n=1 Tax=Agrocybe pediades TaxID=84607 RepID=A0A8H4QPM0_9AGAR|nr:hypothetical protein D9613_002527 [Agrocybe pediades]
MLFRVTSMRGHSPRVRFTLLVTFVAGVVAGVVVVGVGVRNEIPFPDPVSPLGIHLCMQNGFPPYVFASWPVVLVFEGMVVFFSISTALEHYRSVENASRRLQPSQPTTRLIYILFRDSITFPIIFIILCSINLLFSLVVSPEVGRAIIPISNLAPCILGPRLILNLRKAYYQPFSEECESTIALERIEFNHHLEDDIELRSR